MAYINGKRTVYCRHCYQKGHNRRSCPTLPSETKARYASGGDLARKCGYCKEKGHTIRKCPTRLKDKAEYIAENAAYRRKVLDTMVVHGIGIGALVYRGQSLPLEELKPEALYLVNSIDWDDIQAASPSRYIVNGVSVTADADHCGFMLPDGESRWYTLNVLNGRRESEIRANVPAGWLNGSSNIDGYFRKKSRW